MSGRFFVRETATNTLPAQPSRRDYRCVLVAASLGGPPALYEFLPQLCKKINLPVLVVQHMAEGFTAGFARELHRRCGAISKYQAVEATHKMQIRPHHVYLAPGDFHMSLQRNFIHLDDLSPRENGCRPAADVLFRSAAATLGGAVVGVVLTGMGCDGTSGAEQIKAHGGWVIAQDKASSAVWGMPRSVVMAGLADEVLPLPEMADAVTRRVALGIREF